MNKEGQEFVDFAGMLYRHLRSIITNNPPETFQDLRVVYRYRHSGDGEIHEKEFCYEDLNPAQVEKFRALLE